MTLRNDNPTLDDYYTNSPLRAENEALFDKCHRIGAKGGKLLSKVGDAIGFDRAVMERQIGEYQHELRTINLEALERIRPLLGFANKKRCDATILYLNKQLKGGK